MLRSEERWNLEQICERLDKERKMDGIIDTREIIEGLGLYAPDEVQTYAYMGFASQYLDLHSPKTDILLHADERVDTGRTANGAFAGSLLGILYGTPDAILAGGIIGGIALYIDEYLSRFRDHMPVAFMSALGMVVGNNSPIGPELGCLAGTVAGWLYARNEERQYTDDWQQQKKEKRVEIKKDRLIEHTLNALEAFEHLPECVYIPPHDSSYIR